MAEPVWIVFDERAAFGDTSEATVLESFGWPDVKTDAQAIRSAKRTWQGCTFVLCRYDLNEKREAYNERVIYSEVTIGEE
jgi:hypothetical protein